MRMERLCGEQLQQLELCQEALRDEGGKDLGDVNENYWFYQWLIDVEADKTISRFESPVVEVKQLYRHYRFFFVLSNKTLMGKRW